MASLFSDSLIPLASKLRPITLNDCIGQKHLLGEGKMFRNLISGGKIPSMILWGPPGVGKTTLARIISQSLDAKFFHLSGVLSKKEDLLSIIQTAKQQFDTGLQTIVFLDEIHRWTKTQQDVLLPWVEKGVITLIGATTENPAFTINNALLSRCLIFQLELPTQEELLEYLQKLLPELQRIFPKIIFPSHCHDNKFGSSPVDGIYLPNILALWRGKTCIGKNPEFETRKQEKLSSSFLWIYPHQKHMKLLV